MRLLSGLALAGLLAACGVSTAPSTSAEATSSAAAPAASAKPVSISASAAAKPAASQPAAQTVQAFFTQDGKLVAETGQASGPTPARAALTLLLAGPKAAGHITEIPKGTELQTVAIQNDVASVSLSEPFFAQGGASGTQLRLAQVVYTVTQFPDATSVQLLRDGQTVGLIGEGFPLNRPLTRQQFASLAP